MEEILIEGDDLVEIQSDSDLENINLDDKQQIQGFFSFLKKTVRKATKLVKSVSKIPVLGAMIPPQLTMGASFLSHLVKAEKKTGKKVKFSTTAVKGVYSNAFMKGRLFERKRMLKQLKKN